MPPSPRRIARAPWEPIAVVGQGCVLPGALHPRELWQRIEARDDLTGPPPAELIPPAILARLHGRPGEEEHVAHFRGGFVRDFRYRFPADCLAECDDDPQALQPELQWTLAACLQALADAELEHARARQPFRLGLVIGNLGYPTRALTHFAAQVWCAEQGVATPPGLVPVDAGDRFHCGFSAARVARLLGATAPSFALDAACASGLYAIKRACDALHDGRADLVLAGGINAADPLVIYPGFAALAALSPSGRSRPFHRQADGLLPAAGVAMAALMRASDAIRRGIPIAGLIHGVGLSNNGRQGTFLLPSKLGQMTAIRSALRQARWEPSHVTLMECHATGTQLGDRVELQTLGEVFAGHPDLPIGSLKGNLGHLITAAGSAALIKVLQAMRAGMRPATLSTDDPCDESQQAPLRLLRTQEEWPHPRLAGVSAFGFGGTNAHLLVSMAHEPAAKSFAIPELPLAAQFERCYHSSETQPLAIVAIDVETGNARDLDEFSEILFGERSPGALPRPLAELELEGHGLPFPPRDLEETLPQQLWLTKLVQRSIQRLNLAVDSTGVFIGIGCDAESARHPLRIHLKAWWDEFDAAHDDRSLSTWQAALWKPLQSATVVGRMPNIPANRANYLLDLRGEGFTVFAEELSGVRALEIAARAIRAGELSAAVVGAVDLCCEPVHQSAAEELLPGYAQVPGDAAVVLVIKRLDDAVAAGDPIWAVLEETGHDHCKSADDGDVISTHDANAARDGVETFDAARAMGDLDRLTLRLDREHPGLAPWFGHAHAAAGLLLVAGGAVCLRHRIHPAAPPNTETATNGNRAAGSKGPWPWFAEGDRAVQVEIASLGGERSTVRLAEAPEEHRLPITARRAGCPVVECYAAENVAALSEAVSARRTGGAGPVKLALFALAGAELERARAAALDRLATPMTEDYRIDRAAGYCFAPRPFAGKIAAILNSAAATYRGMGRRFLVGFPEITAQAHHHARLDREVMQLFDPQICDQPISTFAKFAGSVTLTYLQARFVEDVWRLPLDMVGGISSGERDAVYAFGYIETDYLHHSLGRMREIGYLDEQFGGKFELARKAWNLPVGTTVDWTHFRVVASLQDVQAALAGEPRVHLGIIHTDRDCVLMGERAGCLRVLKRLNDPASFEITDYRKVFHVPEARLGLEAFEYCFRLPCRPRPELPLFSAVTGAPVEQSEAGLFEAFVRQGTETVDFPRLVENLYAHGARIFVELGPRNLAGNWIRKILGPRQHVSVSIDNDRTDGLSHLAETTALLYVLGVPISVAPFAAPPVATAGAPLRFPLRFTAHYPKVEFPMEPARPSRRPDAAPAADQHALRATSRSPAPANPGTATGASPTIGREPKTPVAPSIHADLAAQDVYRMAPPPLMAAVGIEVLGGTPTEEYPAPVIARHAAHPAAVDRSPTYVAMQSIAEDRAPSIADDHRRVIDETLAILSESWGDLLARQQSGQTQFLAVYERLYQGLVAVGRFAADDRRMADDRSRAHVSRFAADRVVEEAAFALANAAESGMLVWEQRGEQRQSNGDGKSYGNGHDNGHDNRNEQAGSSNVPAATPAARRPRAVDRPNPTGQPGPYLERDELIILARGKISDVFGPLFEQQDDYWRQVRLPEPPLLLVDRITGIDAPPGVHGKGTIWTETDVRWDSWFLHNGRIPAGVMIEAGQADLTLISWMGADFKNRSQRVYRLLGCDLTYHRSPAKAGETLRYKIQIDGHAAHGDIRMFFFHYDATVDGQPQMSVRGGQAGFFTDEELSKSGGVLWDADTGEHNAAGRVDPAPIPCARRSFSKEEVQAYFAGRVADCLGPNYDRLRTHNRTPIAGQPGLQLFDEILDFDPHGGPWGKGYLRTRLEITPDRWFFQGHFFHDPCMPGTLMFEGAMQSMAFYLTALGVTIERDGWRFEPASDELIRLRCRGQAIPSSQELIGEIFVEEFHAGPIPILYADILGTVDGLKAFHARRVPFRLVPDWPLEEQPVPADLESHPLRPWHGDEYSVLSAALGRPSAAFGPAYASYDGPQRTPRLPSPPYLMVTRIREANCPHGVYTQHGEIIAELDFHPDDWFFHDSPSKTMPITCLMEAGLQPCGWLAAHMGVISGCGDASYFRNLDGTGRVFREVRPADGRLTSHVRMLRVSRFAGSIVMAFAVTTYQDGEMVMEMETGFGLFTRAALDAQAGLPPTADEQARIELVEGSPRDFALPVVTHAAALARPSGILRMVDRIRGYWPQGSKAGLGRVVAERDVDYSDWYFRAHFFQDPVQPGSLGVEALVQVLGWAMEAAGLTAGFQRPRLEPIANQAAIKWRYRGQVLPHNKLVLIEVEVLEQSRDAAGVLAVAEGWVWIDGMRIYHAPQFSLRIVEGS